MTIEVTEFDGTWFILVDSERALRLTSYEEADELCSKLEQALMDYDYETED